MRREFITGDGNGQWYVIGDGDDLDAVQASGAWIKTQEPADLRP